MAGRDVFDSEADLDATFDTTGTSADDLNSGGIVTEECKAHLLVVNVKKEAKEGKVPCLVFDLQVMASDKPKQKGKFVYHRVYLKKGVYTGEGKDRKMIDLEPISEGSLKAVLRFALGLSLITPDDIGKKDLKIPWSKATGQQCMSELRLGQENDNGKKYIGIQYGEVFPVGDERVKDWPRDAEAGSATNLEDF